MARVDYVTDDQAPPDAKGVFDAAQSGFGLVFNTYRVLAHRPEILQAWHQLLASILGAGTVEPQLKMLAFTTGSRTNDCHYWASHGAGLVQATGGSEDKVRHLLDEPLSAGLYDERERAVITYAHELAATATVGDETFAALARHFPDTAELVEIHMAAALPNITNRVNDPFQVDLDAGVAPVPT